MYSSVLLSISHCYTTSVQNFLILWDKLCTHERTQYFLLLAAPGNHHYIFCFHGLDYSRYFIYVNRTVFVLLWVNIVPSWFIVSNIPSCATFGMWSIHAIHSFVDGYLDCFHLLAVANSAAMKWEYKYLFKTLLLILLAIYPEVEFLNHKLTVFLIFWGTIIPFFMIAALLYFHQPVLECSNYSHPLRQSLSAFFW